jgi:membrane fusion protein (multidrug efflux system)
MLAILLCLSAFWTFGCSGGEDSKGDDTKSEESNATNGKIEASEEEKSEGDKKADEKDAKKEGENKGEELIPVETTLAMTGDISSYILLSSNLETEEMADVYARVQGLVEQIYADEGEVVRKGQTLLKLEPEEYALEEERARVDYEQENSLFERKRTMFEKSLLSKEEFETAKFAKQAKEVLWKQAKLNLDYTRLSAPIDGVVGERLVRPGDRVQPSDKLFTVINQQELIAVVHIPEKEVGQIKNGQQAYITSQHLADQNFSGRIKRVSPVVDPQSGTFKVTIGVADQSNSLRPGMFVNAHIITDTHEGTVLIPKTALVYENENLHVFVVRDSIATKVTLAAGYQDFEKIESLRGIDAGEKIIVVGQAGLKDKSKVKVVAERKSTLEGVAKADSNQS